MAAGFSRLQLAAALLEYDNDPENPDAPHRSAHESAIFAHLRRNAGNRPLVASHKNDHLDVSLPTGDGVSTVGRESAVDNAKSRGSRGSRGSIDALRNPFGADDNVESEDAGEEDELEVDLASWGLDAFMPRVKASKNGKGKARSADLSSPPPVSSVPSHHPLTRQDVIATAPRRALGASRSMSVGGNLEYFGAGGATLDEQPSTLRMDNRRRSIGSPLDLVDVDPLQIPTQRRRASSHTLIQTNASSSLQSVPFPTTSVRSPSPHPANDTDFRSLSHASRLRSPSSNTDINPMITPRVDEPTSADRPRTMSNATMATILLADDNPFTLRPPSRASRFDPKAAAHARTMSNASLGSRMLLDNDGMSVITGQVRYDQERRYSTTLELLRPKVLVMPSPLQPATVPAPPSSDQLREGFQLSTGGPPLPPGARSARRSSATLSMIEPSSMPPPIASNSFTPNPLMNLSLSQMTFRNTLVIGGQRESTYADMEGGLPRATQDGEQVDLDGVEPENHETSVLLGVEDASKLNRPAGKLFGKSLIDDLENRKAQMRSKQRVFTGDERPSMMARGRPQGPTTLIDPAALPTRPTSQHMSSYGSQGSQQLLSRRNSSNAKPLLTFDDDNKFPQKNIPSTRLPSSRSVFGVDTLWEREMVKLQEIEAREKSEAEQRRKTEEAEENRKHAKKSKRKGKTKVKNHGTDLASPIEGTPPEPRVSAEPPTLPDIQRAARKPPPHIPDDDESESDGSDVIRSDLHVRDAVDTKWFAQSSDEEDDAPRRTTGTGPRSLGKHQRQRTNPPGNDSEEDTPLSVAVDRAVRRVTHLRREEGSDDEGKPLSTLLQKKQSNLPSVNFDNLLNPDRQNEDDDDQPLGLRASRVAPSSRAYSHAGADGDDDDRPLAYHPEQQRRTQYQMMAQQQQQQIMLQAQMQRNMFFSAPPMMGSGLFGPPMVPMMVQAPVPMPSPPPMHDEAKYGRVDRWRHDVAVEGDH